MQSGVFNRAAPAFLPDIGKRIRIWQKEDCGSSLLPQISSAAGARPLFHRSYSLQVLRRSKRRLGNNSLEFTESNFCREKRRKKFTENFKNSDLSPLFIPSR